MLIYLFATIGSTLLAWLSEITGAIRPGNPQDGIARRFSKPLFVASFVVLFLLSGFRVDVGIDYPSYVALFNDIYVYGFNYFEPAYQLLITVIQFFTSDPQWLFIVSSFMTLGLIYTSIKKYSINPAFSVFLFCTMGFLSHSFNLTRQFIAVAIILYSLSYVINGRAVKWMLMVILAALFHKTAFIMLPIYFLLRMKIAPVYYLLITIIAGLFAGLQGLIVENVVLRFYPQYYDEGIIDERIVSSYYIIICFSLVLSVMYLLHKKRISMKNMSERIMVNAIFLIMLAHIFFVWVPLSNRVSLYLDIMLILFIPKLLSYVESILYKRIFLATVTSYFMYAGYQSLQDNANGVLPYKSSLFSATDVQDINRRALV